ncbi:MAG: Crp/Fnr family transcriptional regulator [Gammaproteobacteria bacterium]|nr:Crp/Fnr family transcriptional regulator [Gammaproteobacteria bacterium]
MLTTPHLHNWRTELSEECQQALADCLTYKTLRKGDFLHSIGEEALVCYQVEQGKVKIGNHNKDGREIIHGMMHQGDCFGELTMVLGNRRNTYALAHTDAEVNLLHQKHYIDLSYRYPELSLALNKFFSARLQYLSNNYEAALLETLYERLGNTILRQVISGGLTDENGKLYLPDISQEMLGQMVGATRQGIGRELKKMEKIGLVHIHYGKIYINDIEYFTKLFGL